MLCRNVKLLAVFSRVASKIRLPDHFDQAWYIFYATSLACRQGYKVVNAATDGLLFSAKDHFLRLLSSTFKTISIRITRLIQPLV